MLIVILPLTLVGASLAQEAAVVVGKMKSGQFNLGTFLQQILDAVPQWAKGLLDRFGVANLGGMQDKLTEGLVKGSQYFASQALNIGQSTFDFIINLGIMLYLLFFLFKDGEALSQRVKNAIPLRPELRDDLMEKFTVVIRATVKGGILVGAGTGRARRVDLLDPWHQCRVAVGRADGVSVAVACGGSWPRLDAGRALSAGDGLGRSGRDPDRLWISRHRSGRQHPAPDAGRQGYQAAGLSGADRDARGHRCAGPQWLRRRSGDRCNVCCGLGDLCAVAQKRYRSPLA